MKRLNLTQIVDQLNAGRAVEQWLGATQKESYGTIRWLRIDRESDGTFSLAAFESFDDGSSELLDVYSFEAIDPDHPNGEIAEFTSLEDALKCARERHGADDDNYVGDGMIQEAYAGFLAQKSR